MDPEVLQWEAVAYSFLNDHSPDVRKKAEEKIQEFRTLSQPYNLCHAILTSSSNDLLLYEAGRCLSHAVVKEWDSVFAETVDNGDDSRAKQLMTFILTWSEQRGPQVSAAPRQRVLSVAGALAKRAASAVATSLVSSPHNTHMSSKEKLNAICHRLEQSNADDQCLASSHLVLQLFDHIESLIRAVIECDPDTTSHQEKQSALHRCLLGLCILSAVLNEWSFSEDSTYAELTLEAHKVLEARFQNHELLRMFCLLLRLTERVVRMWTKISSLDAVESDLLFRLVSCLEAIFSWDFLCSGFYQFRRRYRGSKTVFCPSTKWSAVLGPESLPRTLTTLLTLHMLVRESESLTTRTLSCLLRLVSIEGSLAEPVSSRRGDEIVSKPPETTSHLYLLIIVNYLTTWLTDPSQVERPRSSTVLDSLTAEQREVVRGEFSRLGLLDASLPNLRLDQLNPVELSLLAEVFGHIGYRMSIMLERIETALEPPTRMDHPQYTQLVYLPALVSLIVLDCFFDRVASVFIQCLKLSCGKSPTADEHELHLTEAVERLSSTWIEIIQFFLFTTHPDSRSRESRHAGALPLTACGREQQEFQTHHIGQLLQLFNGTLRQHRVRLCQSYVMSKLASPDGFRACSEDAAQIDLELDVDDAFAYESSLYTCASCGLADANQTASTLYNLINDRTARLILTHNSATSNPEVVELYEDVHWILLITGHFIVTGPSSLGSVSRRGLWCTEFAIPNEFSEASTVGQIDHTACGQLLQLVTAQCPNPHDSWPPTNLPPSGVPVLIKLFSSLFRLLWIQSEHHVGSAQLMEDTLWVMARLALSYLCLVVRNREYIADSNYSSSLLSVFHVDCRSPSSTHRESANSHSELVRACLHALLTCACSVLNKWSTEPKVVSMAVCLIRIIARHAPNASLHLSCPAWFDLCSLLCNPTPDGGLPSRLNQECLMELVESCLCGSWLLDKQRTYSAAAKWETSGSDDPLVLQLLHHFRQTLSTVFSRFTSDISSTDILLLVQSMATLRGVIRFCGFAASQLNSAQDLISFIWTGFLYPTLEASVCTLLLNYLEYPEVTRTIVEVYSDVAECCFIYLVNIPTGGTTSTKPSLEDCYCVAGSYASTAYLNLVIKLFRVYGLRNAGALRTSLTAEEDFPNQIISLLSMLNRLASEEFEFRLVSSPHIPSSSEKLNGSMDSSVITVQPADVITICFAQLFPLFTETLLMIPDACRSIYEVLSTACELRVESLSLLNNRQLEYLGQLIRVGIFGPQASIVVSKFQDVYQGSTTLRSLEALKVIADQCLDVRYRTTEGDDLRAQNVNRICTFVGLNAQLLKELFILVLSSTFDLNVEMPLSSAILCLIHMDPDAYLQIVSDWLASYSDPTLQARLQAAFERLGCDPEYFSEHATPSARIMASFTRIRPSALTRANFQHRFHRFVSDVRAFACRI